MKVLKIAIFLFLIAFGAYSIFWFKQSSELENLFKKQIDSLTRNENNHYSLKYDSIESGGYPFNFSLALINPTITEIPIDIMDSSKGAEIKINGKIIDHFTLSGDFKSVEYTGKANITIPSQDEEPNSSFLVDGNMLLESKNGSLIPVDALKSLVSVDQILNNFWEYLNLDDSSVHLSNLKILDMQKNLPIVNFDKFDMHFNQKQIDQLNQTILFEANMKGFDISEFISYGFSLQDASGFLEKLYREFMLALNSKRGKTGFDLNLTLNVPNNEEISKILKRNIATYITLPLPEFSISLDWSTNTGAFGGSTVKSNFAIKHEDSKEETIALKLDGSTANTQAYVDALVYALDKMSQTAALLEPENENEKKIIDLLVNHRSNVMEIIPKTNECGTFQELIDMNIKLNRNKLDSKIKIDNFALLCKLYGIQLHGEVDGSIRSTTGAMTLDVLNYETFIRDLTAYINKLIPIFNLVDFQVNKIPVTLEERVLKYLREISNEPQTSSKDIHITAAYLDGEGKVGTLNVQEFVEKSKEVIGEIEDGLKPANT
jgi:hypothetical protein